MNFQQHDRLTGKQAEKWFSNFSHQIEINSDKQLSLEKLIRLLNQELPKRFSNGLCDLDRDYPDGDRWIRQVLKAQSKLAIPEEVKQNFAKYLLDQVASTDAIIAIPSENGSVTRVAVDVTVNPRQIDSKLSKIKGLPDPLDKQGENRNQNIARVRKALDIDKHLVLLLDSERQLLPSYEKLLSELDSFLKSSTITGLVDLKELQPEETIGGVYLHLAESQSGRRDVERLTAIADKSIQLGHHPSYTAQIMMNDRFIRSFGNIAQAFNFSEQYAKNALRRTPQYQTLLSVKDILNKYGKTVEGNRIFKGKILSFEQKGTEYFIHATDNRGTIFHARGWRCFQYNLSQAEQKNFQKHYKDNISRSKSRSKGRGLQR